ncbi:class I SAM-dependent methyltransferase [Methanocella sp. MCL-LM]|uniref:class I SAM-dependent methyltransferase n=1 Tax=Methanocella sp. MCL-LM TaxID=3412035 RepID=UPI003C752246
MTIADPGRSLPEETGEITGISEHMGGTKATDQLLKMTGAAPGHRVIDMGCGTGLTATTMAKRGIDVIAVDIDSRALAMAKARSARSDTAEMISFIQADLHNLPFREETFDVAVAESALAFCDAGRVSGEANRVLKSGGTFGFNEMTYLQAPDPALKAVLRLALRASPHQEREWKVIFQKAGFTEVVGKISKISLPGQFLSHLKTHGMLAHTRALIGSLFKPGIGRAFLNPKTREMVMKFRSYVGYGLYTGRKP